MKSPWRSLSLHNDKNSVSFEGLYYSKNFALCIVYMYIIYYYVTLLTEIYHYANLMIDLRPSRTHKHGLFICRMYR